MINRMLQLRGLLPLALGVVSAACASGGSPATTAATTAGSASAAPSPSADEREAVLAVVRRLFDAMRAGDSAGVRAAFHPAAQLSTAHERDGRSEVEIDSLAAFVRAVGTPHDEVWDERVRNEVVHIDGPLAVVWAEYSFYAGGKFSHCGVDAFQLARTGAGWQIVAIADTRRRTGCPDPAPSSP